METIFTFILRDRVRAGHLARAAMFSGGWLLIASALGAAMMNAFAAPIVRAGQIAPATLGEMFPDAPLFWVPEGPLGYMAASVLLLGGIWLGLLVDRVERNR
jgi:hypothetical protein